MLNTTNAIGELSYVVRTCYDVGDSLEENWNFYIGLWDSAMSIFNMFKSNIVNNATDIDSRSWSAYQTAINSDWDDFVYDTTRLVYLFFL